MTHEYDFEMVKRAYAEMARRASEKNELRRPPNDGAPPQASRRSESPKRQPYPA